MRYVLAAGSTIEPDRARRGPPRRPGSSTSTRSSPRSSQRDRDRARPAGPREDHLRGARQGLQLVFETVAKVARDQVERPSAAEVAPFLVPRRDGAVRVHPDLQLASVLPLHWNGNDRCRPPTADVNLVSRWRCWCSSGGTRPVPAAAAVRQADACTSLKGHCRRSRRCGSSRRSAASRCTATLRQHVRRRPSWSSLIGALLPAYVVWLPNGGWKLFDLFIGLLSRRSSSLLTIIYFSQAMEMQEDH